MHLWAMRILIATGNYQIMKCNTYFILTKPVLSYPWFIGQYFLCYILWWRYINDLYFMLKFKQNHFFNIFPVYAVGQRKRKAATV